MKEQKNVKEDPPILKRDQEVLTTTLTRYETYDAYFKIFFPLLLTEMWACISSDFVNQKTWNEKIKRYVVQRTKVSLSQNKILKYVFHCNLYRTEYDIKVDEIKHVNYCPMTHQSKHKKQADKHEDDSWVIVTYHGNLKLANIMQIWGLVTYFSFHFQHNSIGVPVLTLERIL